jgi:hypothetical protein
MIATLLTLAFLVVVATILLVIHLQERRATRQEQVDAIGAALADEFMVTSDTFDHRDPAARPLWRITWVWTKPSPYNPRGRHVWCVAFRVALDEQERARRRIGIVPPRHVVRTILFEWDDTLPVERVRAQAEATARSYHEAFTEFLWGRQFHLPRGLERLMGRES